MKTAGMNRAGSSVLAFCVAALVMAAAGCSSVEKRASSGSAVGSTTSWKADRASFDEHMKQVQPGWKVKHLLDYAGEPSSISNGKYRYLWVEHPAFGGSYVYYMFTVEGDRVTSVDARTGETPAGNRTAE